MAQHIRLTVVIAQHIRLTVVIAQHIRQTVVIAQHVRLIVVIELCQEGSEEAENLLRSQGKAAKLLGWGAGVPSETS